MNELMLKKVQALYERAYSSGTDVRDVTVPRRDLIAALDMLHAMDIVQADALELLQPGRHQRRTGGKR